MLCSCTQSCAKIVLPQDEIQYRICAGSNYITQRVIHYVTKEKLKLSGVMLAESVKLVDREFFFFLLFFLHLRKDNLLFTVNISFFKNASFNTLKAKFTLNLYIVGYKILNERKERGKKVPNVNFLLKLEYFDETPKYDSNMYSN